MFRRNSSRRKARSAAKWPSRWPKAFDARLAVRWAWASRELPARAAAAKKNPSVPCTSRCRMPAASRSAAWSFREIARPSAGMPRNWRWTSYASIFFTTAGSRRRAAPKGPDLPCVCSSRWVRPENLHVTLEFIGEVPETKLASIRTALAGVRSDQPVALDFRGLGFFPNEKHPRVFWAGIEASRNLKTLAEDIEKAAENLGMAREQQPF